MMNLLQLQRHLTSFYSRVNKSLAHAEANSLSRIINNKYEHFGLADEFEPQTVTSIEKSILLANKLNLSFDINRKQASIEIIHTAQGHNALVLDILESGLNHIFSKEPNFELDSMRMIFSNEACGITGAIMSTSLDKTELGIFNGELLGGVCALKSRKTDHVITTTITTAELKEIAGFYNTPNLTPHFCYRQLLKRALKTLYTPHHTTLFNLKEALHFQDALRNRSSGEIRQLSENELQHYL